MSRKGVQSSTLASTAHPLDKLVAWQLACMYVAIALIWMCEVFDFPALFCGAAKSSVDWLSAGFLSTFVFSFGLAATVPVHIHRRRTTGKSITICSYCRRVQLDASTWDQIEAFFAQKTSATYSHGVCPDCCSKVMTAYRSGRQDAGAREPLGTEVLI